MRRRSLVLFFLVLACTGCRVRVPAPPGVKVKLGTKAKVRVRADVNVRAEVPPPAPVALEGAEVPEFFGVPLDGAEDVVFVLDRSGSMDEPAQGRIAQIGAAAPTPEQPAQPVQRRKIDVAHLELVDALERLPAGTRVNVIFFNSDVEAYAPDLVALDEAGREGLVTYVTQTFPSGATALAPAMRIAFLMNPRRIVLLSDGLGNVGGGAAEILRDFREAARGGLRVDTIGLGRNQNAALLETLATESGGLYQSL